MKIQVHDFVDTQLTHNRSYAFRLPPTFIEQSRDLVNFHEYKVFSDKNIGGIGNSQYPCGS
jgi:lysosomal acid phosphatase